MGHSSQKNLEPNIKSHQEKLMAPFSGDEKEGLYSGQGLKEGSGGPRVPWAPHTCSFMWVQMMKVQVWTLEAGRTSSVERSPS